MRQVYRLKPTDGRAVISEDVNHDTSLSQSIQYRFMCGLASAILVERSCAYLKIVNPNIVQGERKFYEEEGVNWWPTPPESPDLNMIENLWHELKEYIRREVKPTSKEQLILGIKEFLKTHNCKMPEVYWSYWPVYKCMIL